MSITVSGLTELYQRFDHVAATRILEPPMQRGVLRLEASMKVYPPPPANSTYRRSGSYGRRWTHAIMRTGDGLIGSIGNNIRYAIFVGSSKFQAAVHRNRWTTDEQAARQNEQAIVADFARAIDRAVKE